MYKLIALYRKPEDVDAFMKHYIDVHTPIVNSIPGLKNCVVNRVNGTPMGGEPEYFLIAEMIYETKQDFDQGMRSKENMAAGKDLANFARGLVTLVTAES